MATLHDAFIEQLKDLHNAEKQLIQALPKMAKAASDDKLRKAFEQHLDETRGHVERLEKVFEELDASPGGVKCEAMEGLVEEGEDALESFPEGPVRDAMLIASAQRIEHYEIAGYGTVRTWAKELGFDDAARHLNETLDEESATDEKLNEIATGSVNREASRAA